MTKFFVRVSRSVAGGNGVLAAWALGTEGVRDELPSSPMDADEARQVAEAWQQAGWRVEFVPEEEVLAVPAEV